MVTVHDKLKKKISYVGWVGHSNLGDEALYRVNTEFFNQYQLVPSLKKKCSKISLFGGGTLLPHYAQKLYPNRYNYAIGVGVRNPAFWGPLDSYATEMVKRHKFRFLGVRGNISKQILKSIEIDSQVVGDPCLLLKPTLYPKKKNQVIAINVGISPDKIWGNNEYLLLQVIEFCKTLKKDGYSPVLVPFWKEDLLFIQKISEAVKVDIFTEWNDIQKVLDFIASCYVLVGQKLHSVVFSAATYTPFICMEYRPKCLDFTESIGFKKYTLRTDDVKSSKLTKLFYDLLYNWPDNHHLLVTKVEYYRKTLNHFIKQVIDDIESLPDDKWDPPSYLNTIDNRVFWGREFLIHKHLSSFWNTWSSSSLRKHINFCRTLLSF